MEENYNVLFIKNKSINEDDKGESSDIKSKLKFLKYLISLIIYKQEKIL